MVSQLEEIKKIGKRIKKNFIFYKKILTNPCANFIWDYILVDNDKVY